MAAPLTGVVPVVPTIFHDDETVDLGGTVRVVDYLMDAGVDGLCLLANYSEQFCGASTPAMHVPASLMAGPCRDWMGP